jgi:hypothetical protein
VLVHSTDLEQQATCSADKAPGFVGSGILLCMGIATGPEEKHGKDEQVGRFEHG